MRQVRESRKAPHNPKSPMKKMMIPKIMTQNAAISNDDNGNELRLNR